MSTPSPEALFAIARAINVAAQIEVEAGHIPPSNNRVACVCDDNGSLDSPTSERHGELRLTLDIERWREGTKTYTEGGRAELNAEAAAVARIRDFAQQYGRLGAVGDGSGEYGAQTCYELDCRRPNYRIYDGTGSGMTEDIIAESDDEATEKGREWIEDGDWGGDDDARADRDSGTIGVASTIELECSVGPLIYAPREECAILEKTHPTLAQYEFRVEEQDDGSLRLVSYISSEDYSVDAARIRDEVMKNAADGLVAAVEISTYHAMFLTPGPAWPLEVDENATRRAGTWDCSGRYESNAPDCPISEGWNFVGTDTAGMDEFGCRGHGGTAITSYEVCRNTGIYRDTYDPGSQRNPGQPLSVATYRSRDAASEKYVIEYHEKDGWIPDWLAEYFDRLPTTRFTPETAVDWMKDRDADLNSGAGCLSGDEIEEVEHVFAALSDARRRPSESERQAFRLFGEEQPFVCPVPGVDYRLEIIGRNELGAIIARPVRDGVALDEATVAAFARMNPQDFSDAGEAAKQSIGWLAGTCRAIDYLDNAISANQGEECTEWWRLLPSGEQSRSISQLGLAARLGGVKPAQAEAKPSTGRRL